ncbi:MAG: hypothetical protein N2V77_05690 [Canidatus Methanoxibalbensis ujae]|nr:hypothetical protein [Candidatus Methanoxibalbensis ujae]
MRCGHDWQADYEDAIVKTPMDFGQVAMGNPVHRVLIPQKVAPLLLTATSSIDTGLHWRDCFQLSLQ